MPKRKPPKYSQNIQATSSSTDGGDFENSLEDFDLFSNASVDLLPLPEELWADEDLLLNEDFSPNENKTFFKLASKITLSDLALEGEPEVPIEKKATNKRRKITLHAAAPSEPLATAANTLNHPPLILKLPSLASLKKPHPTKP